MNESNESNETANETVELKAYVPHDETWNIVPYDFMFVKEKDLYLWNPVFGIRPLGSFYPCETEI